GDGGKRDLGLFSLFDEKRPLFFSAGLGLLNRAEPAARPSTGNTASVAAIGEAAAADSARSVRAGVFVVTTIGPERSMEKQGSTFPLSEGFGRNQSRSKDPPCECKSYEPHSVLLSGLKNDGYTIRLREPRSQRPYDNLPRTGLPLLPAGGGEAGRRGSG